jgi:hypothetical protein
MEGKSKISNSKCNLRNLAFIPSLAVIFSVYSCASSPVISEGKISGDDSSRTYNVAFISFHPGLNLALQDHSKRYKGNSFQITRLGSDAVIIQGFYKAEGIRDAVPTVITAKPAGPEKSRVEIKVSPNNRGASSESLKKVIQELFRIIERGIETPSP